MTRTKVCTRCGVVKELDGFSPDKRMRDGRQSWCKTCSSAVSNKRHTERYANDPEFAERRRERSRVSTREWRRKELSTLEGWLERKNRRARAKARRHGVPVESVDLLAIFDRENWECCVCGESIDKDRRHPDPMAGTVEHVLPMSRGGGHVADNIRVSHHKCNERKRTKTLEEMNDGT